MSKPSGQTAPPSTTFFFPLRTNVHYFDSPEEQLALIERVKQASLLYETLLFEGGIYDAVVWKDEERGGGPSFDMCWPPQNVTDDLLNSYQHKPTGGEAHVQIDEFVFASGLVDRRQHAEFHSLLKQLNAVNLPWMRMGAFGLPSELTNLARRLALDDNEALDDLLSDKPRFLKSTILNNLNHDLILTSQLGVAASMDGLFEPLVLRKAQSLSGLQPALGFVGLSVALPNLSRLPWNEIVDIREQESLKELRRKILEIEMLARTMAQGDVKDLQLRISQIINDELLKEIIELMPKGSQVAADFTFDILLSFVVSAASPVITGLIGLGKLEAFNSSWIAAFLKLKKAA